MANAARPNDTKTPPEAKKQRPQVIQVANNIFFGLVIVAVVLGGIAFALTR